MAAVASPKRTGPNNNINDPTGSVGLARIPKGNTIGEKGKPLTRRSGLVASKSTQFCDGQPWILPRGRLQLLPALALLRGGAAWSLPSPRSFAMVSLGLESELQ